MTSLIFMGLIHSFNLAFPQLLTPTLCTDKILLITSKRNTTQAVLSQKKGIHYLMYLESLRVQLVSHTKGLNDVPKYLSSSSFPSFPSSFSLFLFSFSYFSSSHPSATLSLWQVEEPLETLNKHPSSLNSQGKEVVQCWHQPKCPREACVICPHLKPISVARSLG